MYKSIVLHNWLVRAWIKYEFWHSDSLVNPEKGMNKNQFSLQKYSKTNQSAFPLQEAKMMPKERGKQTWK